jgi:hypothetical protein
MTRRTDPAVWILWTGDPDGGQMIHSIFGSREAACHKLCDLVLRGQNLTSPKIERKVVSDTSPINGTNADVVARVISAYRSLASAGKTDMGRANLGPLRAALEALCYPMALTGAGPNAGAVDLGDDPDGDLAGYDGRR